MLGASARGETRTLTSDVEMRLQDDEEEHEQQEVDDGMDEHGREAGLHVHEVDGPLPAGHLQDAARAQEREQRRRDDRRRPVPHRCCAVQARPCSIGKQKEQEREKFTSGRQVTGSGTQVHRHGTEGDTEDNALGYRKMEGKHGIGHRAHYGCRRGNQWTAA